MGSVSTRVLVVLNLLLHPTVQRASVPRLTFPRSPSGTAASLQSCRRCPARDAQPGVVAAVDRRLKKVWEVPSAGPCLV